MIQICVVAIIHACIGPVLVLETFCFKRYGASSLSILLTKLHKTDRFSFLAQDIFGGDESWFYDSVDRRMKEKAKERNQKIKRGER